MNEADQTTQKSIYKTPTWWLYGSFAVASMDPYRGRMCVACKSCRGQKQETDKRLAKKKNKKTKSPPLGYVFDR